MSEPKGRGAREDQIGRLFCDYDDRALVLPLVIIGITEASQIRSPAPEFPETPQTAY
jgi:hypothetical protein